jgi:hypothetical protein
MDHYKITISKLYKVGLYGQARWPMPIIPATQEVEIRRVEVQSQSGQKVSENTSHLISQTWWCIPVILVISEAYIETLQSKADPGKKV